MTNHRGPIFIGDLSNPAAVPDWLTRSRERVDSGELAPRNAENPPNRRRFSQVVDYRPRRPSGSSRRELSQVNF